MVGFLFQFLLSFFLFGYVVAPAINREQKTEEDHEYNIEGMPTEVAQLHEYYRYVKRVIHILDADPEFKKRGEQDASDEAIKEGFLTNGLMKLLLPATVEKLNYVKKEEIEHQKKLLADKKEHMKNKTNNEWNPIHHEGDKKDEFTQDDLDKLMNKFNVVQDAADARRKEKFKKHEMKKEKDFRKELVNMTEEQRAAAQKEHEDGKHKTHEKVHAPMHKAQLEEVWEKEDGLDKDSFDLKTLFNLHDKDGDGRLDKYELETMFLSDLDKLYNESDSKMDPLERNEEMERMRESAMEDLDRDKDGFVSFKEYMDDTEREDFEEDPEWKSIPDNDQFSEEELEHFNEEDIDDEEEPPHDE